MTKEHLPELHWMKLMILNVDGDMTDEQFREFVRHNLPTVMGYAHAREELVALGRLPREVKYVELTGNTRKDRVLIEEARAELAGGFQEGAGYGEHDVPCGSQHHYDRDTEPFHKK